MIKKFLALILFALPNFSFGMGGESQFLLERLTREPTSFVRALPRELLVELQYIVDDQIRQAIESSKTFQEAIEELKRLATQTIHVHYFKDLKSLEFIVNALAIQFGKSPDKIAQDLKNGGFEYAERWLNEIQPKLQEFLLAVIKGEVDFGTIKEAYRKSLYYS